MSREEVASMSAERNGNRSDVARYEDVGRGALGAAGHTLSGFKQFLLRGNVVDMAVGIVIGAAFVSVVQGFVRDLLTPLIAAAGGKPDFSQLSFNVHNSKFAYGDFINDVVSFLIVAAVVYFFVFVVLPMTSVLARIQRETPREPETDQCPECLKAIPRGARRCAYCTSPVAPHGAGVR
jgi:large conductance mechanosensitive channel